jgi:hypothetical protein
MSEALPGPHHCLATARVVAEIVYRSLHAQSMARGGVLSVEDPEHCYAQIIESYSCSFDLFEERHFQCMSASLSTAEMPFARDRILATILRACGEPAAREAFPQQVEQWGEVRLSPFFDGFAQYIRHIRRHQYLDADQRVTAAYVDAGLTHKAKFSLAELLKHSIVQNVLRDCARPFEEQPASQAVVRQICDRLNTYGARPDGAAEAQAIKLADDQVQNFLGLLARRIATSIPPEPALHEAELYSLAGRKRMSATQL